MRAACACADIIDNKASPARIGPDRWMKQQFTYMMQEDYCGHLARTVRTLLHAVSTANLYIMYDK